MIRRCTERDREQMLSVINQAAQAYRGVIPSDCWHDPYMPASELQSEIAAGVEFWGYEDAESAATPPLSLRAGREGKAGIVGVMGIQRLAEVTLIRHAYVLPSHQKQGIGGMLLRHLLGLAATPVLVGTWADATWAVRFYQKHGFRLVTPAEKDRLLRRYWRIPERQVETSVVLAGKGAPPP